MPNASFDTDRDAFAPPEMPVFSATLTPNRPLGRRGTTIVVGSIAFVSFLTALPFVVAGAWPVGGFFGLDVVALYFAFRISSLRARAYEEVILSRLELLFRQVSWRGKAQEWRFNPFWVRLHTREDGELGMVRLAVAEGGREVAIGAFLGPEERQDFAKAFGRALANVRR